MMLGIALAIGGAALALALGVRAGREPVAVDDELRRSAPGVLLALPDGATHVVCHGPRDGVPLVLVPGATLSLWIWKGLPERLAAAGYRVVAYDLYGRGYSDRPATRYDAALFDRQLLGVIDACFPDGRVHLVGLAFGCLIAAGFATRHPERTGRLAFLGADGFGVRLSRSDRLLTTPWLGPLLVRLVGNRRLLARLEDYTPDAKVIAWLREHYAPELAWRGFKRALLSSIRHMPIHRAGALYRDLEANGRAPLLVWGSEDRVTPVPNARVLQEILPRADVRILDGIGHLPHVEALDETEALLREHLEKDRER